MWSTATAYRGALDMGSRQVSLWNGHLNQYWERWLDFSNRSWSKESPVWRCKARSSHDTSEKQAEGYWKEKKELRFLDSLGEATVAIVTNECKKFSSAEDFVQTNQTAIFWSTFVNPKPLMQSLAEEGTQWI